MEVGTIVKLLHLRPMALSVVALMATAPAAFALDANDFASKLMGLYATSSAGAVVTFNLGPATVSGNDVSFAGISAVDKSSPDNAFKTDTKFTFSGVSEQPDGSYLADTLTFPDADYKFDGGELVVKNIKLSHIYIPSGKTPNVLDTTRFVGEGSVGPIILSVGTTPTLTIDSVSVSNSFKPSQSEANLAEIDSTGITSGLKFDMSGATDQDALAQAKALDLVTVTGKALETVNWTLGDGHLNVSELSTDFDKVGKLKFGIDITGYTPQFLQNLTSMTQSLSALSSSSGGGGDQAATAMLLNSLQTLFLNSASIRFDDASITGKLLDMSAKQAGVDRAALIDALVGQVAAQMSSDPSSPVPVSVIQTAQAATRAYLTDPHSIEFRLAPKAPLGVLGIVAAAMAPANLADQIGLKILVNDKEITAADAAKETGTPPPPAAGDSSSDSDDNSTAAPSDDNSAMRPLPG